MFASIHFDRANPGWFRLSREGHTLILDTTEIRTIEWFHKYDILGSLKHRKWITYFRGIITYKNGTVVRFNLASDDEGLNYATIRWLLQ